MKRLSYIAILCTFFLGMSGKGFSQDSERLSDRTLTGTARYVGMSGAMTAIGGDPSAVRDNPAGLGLYRRAEAMLTLDTYFDRTQQTENSRYGRRLGCTVSQASVALSFGDPLRDSGVLYHNLMFSYNRMRSYGRSVRADGTEDHSLGTTIAENGVDFGFPVMVKRYFAANSLNLDESGYIDEYAMDWAMNISHKWYIGLGLRIQSVSLIGDAEYTELFDQYNADFRQYSLKNTTSIHYSGVGVGLSAGLIYRPCKWVRMGCSLETPSLGSLTTYTYGHIAVQTDSLRNSYAPDLTNSSALHMPLRLSTSVAVQMGGMAMLALQYDYSHKSQANDIHALRCGVEVVPIPGLYINAGYAYESTFRTVDDLIPIDPAFDRQDAYFQHTRYSQYASFGLGYRGSHMIVQMAYQYAWQALNLYAHDEVAPYDIHTTSHRLVLTLAWHQPRP